MEVRSLFELVGLTCAPWAVEASKAGLREY